MDSLNWGLLCQKAGEEARKRKEERSRNAPSAAQRLSQEADSVGPNTIDVVKTIRNEVEGMGLCEAKRALEQALAGGILHKWEDGTIQMVDCFGHEPAKTLLTKVPSLRTVNVIETCNGVVSGCVSFPDTPEGNIVAKGLFIDWCTEGLDDEDRKGFDEEAALLRGEYTDGDWTFQLAWSPLTKCKR